jgi:hypothetical protein
MLFKDFFNSFFSEVKILTYSTVIGAKIMKFYINIITVSVIPTEKTFQKLSKNFLTLALPFVVTLP